MCILWLLTPEHNAVLRVNASISTDYFEEISTTWGLQTELEEGNLYFKYQSHSVQKTKEDTVSISLWNQLHSLELCITFAGKENKSFDVDTLSSHTWEQITCQQHGDCFMDLFCTPSHPSRS